MKKISEKQLLILLGVPALAVFVFIVYSMLFKNPADSENNNDKNKTGKSSGLVLPAVKDDTIEKSKSTVYEDIANKEAQEKENYRVKSSKDFFSMNDKKNDNNEIVNNNIIWDIPLTHTNNSNVYNGFITLLYSMGSFNIACFINV